MTGPAPKMRQDEMATLVALGVRGACRTLNNTRLFYDPNFEDLAKTVCARCQVRDACLTWALDHDEHGVWGGTTAGERRRQKYHLPAVRRRAA